MEKVIPPTYDLIYWWDVILEQEVIKFASDQRKVPGFYQLSLFPLFPLEHPGFMNQSEAWNGLEPFPSDRGRPENKF